MKLRNLLLTGLAAVGFLACSNDDDLGRDGGRATEGDAYASFTIDTRGLNLHTRAGELEETGTEDEQAVKRLQVVMYSADRVEHVFSYGADGDQGDLSFIKTGKFTTPGLQVKKQDYQVAILLNPTAAAASATQVGKSSKELFDVARDSEVDDYTANGFMMSNAQGLVNVPASALKGSEEDAVKDPIGVNVDRVVAKVIVAKNDDLKVKDGAEVKLEDWTLDVTNKKTYLLRNMTRAKDGMMESLETPRADRYAKDPNFEFIKLDEKDFFANKLSRLAEDFNYFTTIDGKWVDSFDKAEPGKYFGNIQEVGKSLYALENTFEEGVVSQSQATRVVLGATYKPSGITSAENGWLSYKGKPMSKETFNSRFEDALTSEWDQFIDGMDFTFVNEMKNLVIFAAYIESLKGNYEEALSVEGENIYIDSEGKLLPQYQRLVDVVDLGDVTYDNLKNIGAENEEGKGKIDADTAKKIKLKLDQPFVAGNLKNYKDGKSYYPIYIKHFDYDKDVERGAYGRYGVVRNNVYNVEINSINKPGEPVVLPPIAGGIPNVSENPIDPKDPIGKDNDKPSVDPEKPGEPEEPVEKEEKYISYEVTIQPWFKRTQVEDL